MRLTYLLRVSFPYIKRPKGNKYEGKNRQVKPLKTSYKYTAVNNVMREEQNLKYINNPYLSQAEETAYGREHNRRYEKMGQFLASKRKPYKADMTIEEHFKTTVGMGKKWE